MLFCPDLSGQDMRLGMTKDEFINLFGKPDKDVRLDEDGSQHTMLFYGDDSFGFVADQLWSISVISQNFPLYLCNPEGIMVGDQFSSLTKNTDCKFELYSSDNKLETLRYAGDLGNAELFLLVSQNVIIGFTMSLKITEDFSQIREFKAFFDSSYNPVADRPDNSLWPARIKVLWRQMALLPSTDKTSVTCCIPFIPELNVWASYSGKACPAVSRRLVITKYLDGSNIYKQNIVSIVPKADSVPGEGFSGLIVYNNVNTMSCSAWECYENGLLVYSRYPENGTPGEKARFRLGKKVIYTGGSDAISNDDWLIIAANRMDITSSYPESFSNGRTEDNVKAEKGHFTYISKVNPVFKQFENHTLAQTGNLPDKGDTLLAQNSSEVPVSGEPEVSGDPEISGVEEEELPAFLGKTDNLSRIVTLVNDPIKTNFEEKKEKTVLICENSDFCEYTIKMDDGLMTSVNPGRTELPNDEYATGIRYQWFRGKAISNINIKFPYALPVASLTNVKLINDSREKHRSFAVIIKIGEPVFAMRGGRVCKVDDEHSVLICHKDGTFAAYMNVDDICVVPGNEVIPGENIGKCGGGKLSISIFYLDANKIKGDSGYFYTHITPYIRTVSGDVKLETHTEYVSLTDTDIIIREMNSIQKKKYAK